MASAKNVVPGWPAAETQRWALLALISYVADNRNMTTRSLGICVRLAQKIAISVVLILAHTATEQGLGQSSTRLLLPMVTNVEPLQVVYYSAYRATKLDFAMVVEGEVFNDSARLRSNGEVRIVVRRNSGERREVNGTLVLSVTLPQDRNFFTVNPNVNVGEYVVESVTIENSTANDTDTYLRLDSEISETQAYVASGVIRNQTQDAVRNVEYVLWVPRESCGIYRYRVSDSLVAGEAVIFESQYSGCFGGTTTTPPRIYALGQK